MIVIIVNDFGYVNGGASSVAIQSAIGLAESDVAVHFFFSVGPADKRLIKNRRIQIFGAYRKSFLDDPSRMRGAIQGLWNWEEAERLRFTVREAMKRDKVVVHVHGWMKALSPSIFKVLADSGVPTVVTLHDYFLACPNGGFLDYQRLEVCERKALSLSCLACNCDVRSYQEKLWRYSRGLIQEYLSCVKSSPQAFICVSEFAKNKISEYIKDKTLLKLVRNPVDVGVKDRAAGDPNGPLIYIGRLSPEKGASQVAAAARQLKRDCWIIGDGNEASRLRQQYPEVRMLGWQSPHVVQEYLRKSSVLVFPSLWWETNGLVVLEALSQGIPAVVSSATCARELLIEQKTGMIYDSRNIADLIQKINHILDNWAAYNLAAYDHYWHRPWTLSEHVKNIKMIYNKLK